MSRDLRPDKFKSPTENTPYKKEVNISLWSALETADVPQQAKQWPD